MSYLLLKHVDLERAVKDPVSPQDGAERFWLFLRSAFWLTEVQSSCGEMYQVIISRTFAQNKGMPSDTHGHNSRLMTSIGFSCCINLDSSETYG
jgi:hypothetical protein